MVFLKKKIPPKKQKFYPFSMQLFSADAMVFSKKKLKKQFLTPKKWKNGPQKLLIIGPDPLFPQSNPGHSPQPKIDSPYHDILGPDICSLICGVELTCYCDNLWNDFMLCWCTVQNLWVIFFFTNIQNEFVNGQNWNLPSSNSVSLVNEFLFLWWVKNI